METTAIKTSVKTRNHDLRSVLLFAENLAAESVPRTTGHRDECRKRPMADLCLRSQIPSLKVERSCIAMPRSPSQNKCESDIVLVVSLVVLLVLQPRLWKVSDRKCSLSGIIA